MVALVIQHPVKSYEGWKQAFDNDPLGRPQHGVLRHSIHRPIDDPNYVVITLDFGSHEDARSFLEKLRAMWGRVSGPLGLGEDIQARIFDEVEHVEYAGF